jgi:hypothetical protein
MRPLAAVLLCGLVIVACTVSRPSDAFTCATDADCMDNRKCDGGYCVEQNCPSDCTSCSESAKTCTMECSSANDCGSVTCPNGWSCTINCIGGGACNDVTCAGGSKCSINCSGAGACNDISCKDACKCDLQCATGACDTITCPAAAAGEKCTTDGAVGSPCLSSPSGCTKC